MQQNHELWRKLVIFHASMSRFILVLCILLGNLVAARGQFTKPRLRFVGAEQGLQSAVVYRTIEDKNGLVWICTYDGLYVYDGYRAKQIPIKLCDTCKPTAMAVMDLYQHNTGKILILSSMGAGWFNPFTGVMKVMVPANLAANMAEIETVSDSLLSIHGFTPNTLWLNLYTGVYKQVAIIGDDHQVPFSSTMEINLSEPASQLFYIKPSGHWLRRPPGAMHLVPTQQNGSWFRKEEGFDSGRTAEDPFHRTWKYFNPQELAQSGYDFDILDSTGKSIRETLFGKKGPLVLKDFVKDKLGNVWLNTSAGLMVMPANNPGIIDLGEDYPVLKGEHLSRIRIDKYNVLWISTRGYGFIIIDLRNQAFSHITATDGVRGTLHRNFVLGMMPAANNQLLIKHEFPVDLTYTLLDWQTLATQPFRSEKMGLFERMHNISTDSMLSEAFRTGIENFSRTLPDSLKYFRNNNNFYRGKKHGYFVGDQNGLYLMPQGKRIAGAMPAISTKYQGDTLWLATESNGLVAINTASGAVQQFVAGNNSEAGPAHNRVHGLCFDKLGNVWAATSGGLSYYNKQTQRFTHYTTANGLCHNTIYNITIDQQGQLWLGTGNGLCRFDPVKKSFSNFFKEDGLVNSEFNRNSAFTAPNGMVFMGGTNGIDYFFPSAISNIDSSITPLISEVSLPGQQLDPQQSYKLQSNQNNLLFTFTVSDLARAQTCQFQYKLDNSDPGSWQTLSGGHEIQFANLKPGTYTLYVRAVNQKGELSRQEASFHFTIASAWYATWWFRLLAAGLSALAIWLAITYLQRQKLRKLQHENTLIRLQAEKALAIAHERERITADLHDDMGATLSSLHIYGDLAAQVWDTQPEQSKKMIGQIVSGSKELMQNMSDIVWSLKSGDSEKQSLTVRLRNFSYELLTPKGIVTHFDIDETLAAAVKNPLARKNLLLIAKEALNNTAKYSGATTAMVTLKMHDENLLLCITDNGKGFDTSMPYRGNGLENMKLRCARLQGECTISSTPGKGVTICCSFPPAIFSYWEH